MNLKEFRKMFIETSGRYDLWNDDGSDNGIDHYIRLGQKHLETLMYWDKMEAIQNVTLTGRSNFMLQNLRTVTRVSVRSALTDRFVDLVRINLSQARKYAMEDNSETNLPLYYTLYRNRGQVNEAVEADFFDSMAFYQDVVADQNFDSVGVLLTPLTTANPLYVEVEGLFRAVSLVDDEDENYWTIQWPNLLVYATYRELEVVYRNTQGVKDWDGAIASSLIQQEMDFILDESGPISQMQG